MSTVPEGYARRVRGTVSAAGYAGYRRLRRSAAIELRSGVGVLRAVPAG